MIDITTIQTFPVAPSLSQLQTTNNMLTKNNEQIKTALKFIGAIAGAYIVYRVIKSIYEDDRTENELSRD